MKLFKRRESSQEDLRVDWSEERGVSKVLEHSKIIGEGNLTKIKKNQGL